MPKVFGGNRALFTCLCAIKPTLIIHCTSDTQLAARGPDLAERLTDYFSIHNENKLIHTRNFYGFGQ